MLWLVIILVIIIVLFAINKVRVDVKSFFMPTIPLDTGVFGVYCFDGKQGSGKTYSLTKFIKNHAAGRTIYSNMEFKGIDYEEIESVEHLLSLRDKKNVIIVYDEIFTLMDKSTKIQGDLQELLSQQRKMKNILITTAQEWLNIPIDFRRYVRIQVICKTRPLGRFGGILKEEYRDAYEMVWDQLANEYVAPRIALKFSKYEKRIMETYNTYERVNRLSGGVVAAGARKAPLANNTKTSQPIGITTV